MAQFRLRTYFDDYEYILAVHEILEPSRNDEYARAIVAELYHIRVCNRIVKQIDVVWNQFWMSTADMCHALIGQVNIRIQIGA